MIERQADYSVEEIIAIARYLNENEEYDLLDSLWKAACLEANKAGPDAYDNAVDPIMFSGLASQLFNEEGK